MAVGKAKGVPIGDDVVRERMELVDSIPSEVRASLAVDLEHGKKLELPWLSGTVVRLGRELGVPTPANSFAYAALKLNAEGRDHSNV